MEYRVFGSEETQERFRRYLASNPAARRGWIEMGEGPRVGVSEDYVDAFKEIAANFGLEVAPELEGLE